MAAINMNRDMFDKAIESGQLMLVDFWAPWCGYCRRINPAYEKIAEEYGKSMLVGKINIDDEPELSDAEDIEVVPSLILYKDGKAIASIVAPSSKAMIDQFIRENLPL